VTGEQSPQFQKELEVASKVMKLPYGPKRELLSFDRSEIEFRELAKVNPFARLNHKTLAQTLLSRCYKQLDPEVRSLYGQFLDEELGTFLHSLKASGDPFYTKFLNLHGDSTFCSFRLADPVAALGRGIYMFTVNGEIMYIGRCRDSFGKRFNQGYGTIHPKNCYRDGQATNCHINSRVAEHGPAISVYLCAMDCTDSEISAIEEQLICEYRPNWNIQLKNRKCKA
jgi:hypothetical protein